MKKLKVFFTFKVWRNKVQPQYEGKREYKQMAVTPEAHEQFTKLADKWGESIIDSVDIIIGVKR